MFYEGSVQPSESKKLKLLWELLMLEGIRGALMEPPAIDFNGRSSQIAEDRVCEHGDAIPDFVGLCVSP